MTQRILELAKRLWSAFRRLPPAAMAVTVAALALSVAVMAVAMYRTYDYVQHDNDFCLSCHLMADPFERFEQSAHRGLGCKACHRPTPVDRTKMALAQILESPDSIRVHAHVPNKTCAECHVEGDPEEWKLIAGSVGHRIHLESDDPALQGLQCVECHSSGVHEFAAVDKTCGQNGCHESAKIALGRMSDLTVHCASCHDFSKPVPADSPAVSLAGSLSPRSDQCMSCHQMRARLGSSLPADEPHDARCGACHNPHDQERPEDAVRSCAGGGCHARPDTISPFHRGLDTGSLDDCVSCHEPHSWKARGQECQDCHTDPDEPLPPRREGKAHETVASRAAAGMLPEHFEALMAEIFPAAPPPVSGAAASAPAQVAGAAAGGVGGAGAPPDPPRFSHRRHRSVSCTTCHSVQREHGELKMRTRSDCQECHHGGENLKRCATCHTESELDGSSKRPVSMRIGEGRAPRSRELPFSHEVHREKECTACHAPSPEMRPEATCQSCHADHHGAGGTQRCAACHVTAPPGQDAAHDRAAHLGCAGSGCHSDAAVLALPAARNVCMSCHKDMADHYPERECATCHAIDWTHRDPPRRARR